MTIVKQITDAVIKSNIAEVEILTKKALEQKENVQKILDEGYAFALEVVGEKFTTGEIYLSEMITTGMAVKAGMEILRPLLAKSSARLMGTIVVGTVMGDVHDIGKDLVCMMLEGGGFKVIDLGVDVSADKFIGTAQASKADIIAMSALLTMTRATMEEIIQDIRTSELNYKVKVMVGGAALTEDFAARIGADGYATNAALAVKKAKELLGVG